MWKKISGCRCLQVCKSADASVSGGLSWAASVVLYASLNKAQILMTEHAVGIIMRSISGILPCIYLSRCLLVQHGHGHGMITGMAKIWLWESSLTDGLDGFTQGQASASKSLGQLWQSAALSLLKSRYEG